MHLPRLFASCVLPAVLMLGVLLPSASMAEEHHSYPGFAQPVSPFSISSTDIRFAEPGVGLDLVIWTEDFAVYRYGYMSLDGRPWQRVELSGRALGGDWLNGSVSAEIPLEASDFGLSESRTTATRNFVVVYSCSRTSGSWDCHDGWQIARFDATLETGTSYDLLIANGFENGGGVALPFTSTVGGSLSVDESTSYPPGGYSLRIDCDDSHCRSMPDNGQPGVVASIAQGEALNFTVFARSDGTTQGELGVLCLGDDYLYYGHVPDTGFQFTRFTAASQWAPYSVSYTCPSWASYVGVRLSVMEPGSIWFDTPVLVGKGDGGCVPEAHGTTCGGVCGIQLNNCGQQVDCGACPDCEEDSDCDDGIQYTLDMCDDGTCANTLICEDDDGECYPGCTTSSDDDCVDGGCVHYDGVCGDGCDSLTDHDCFAEEHVGWTVFALKDGSDYPNKVYIDPEWTGCESGTMACPYNSWTDVTWQSDTAYMQKRGTMQSISGTLNVEGFSNIYIGAYGTGTRPILVGNSPGLFYIRSENTLFRDIHLQNPGAYLLSGITLFFGGDAPGSVVYNCTVSNSGNDGIFSWAHGLKILYTEVRDIYIDAIWVGNSENVEIAYNYIHDANLMWFDYGSDTSKAGGDAIQFMDGVGIGVDRWWIHHNIIDRSNSGNKFCFHASGTEQDFGIFEHNTLSGPRTDGHGGASVFIPSLWDDGSSRRVLPRNIMVRNNVINGPSPTGVWTEGDGIVVEGNSFDGVTNAITNVWAGDLSIIDNDFSNILGECFSGGYTEEYGNTGDCP